MSGECAGSPVSLTATSEASILPPLTGAPPSPSQQNSADENSQHLSPVESSRRDMFVDELPFPPEVHRAVQLRRLEKENS